jgi:tight adherence protein B
MSSGVALVAMLALACAVAGSLLWRRAVRTRELQRAAQFVERQVQAAGVQADPQRPTQTPPRSARPAPEALPATPPAGIKRRVAFEAMRAWAALDNLMRRAGIGNTRALMSMSLAVGAGVTLAAASRMGYAFGAGVFATLVIALYAWLSWRAQKRQQRITRQLPLFLDGIVRLIVIGHSVPAAFQTSMAATETPLRECLDRALPMLRTGMEIDHALSAVARMYRVRELELVGSVLRVSVKYGGRSDVMLDRMSALMRDLEQADRELIALSTETRLSSWVLGLLPIVLGAAVIVMNPRYFNTMWIDPLGKRLVFVALGLQMLGAWMLYRLARLKT